MECKELSCNEDCGVGGNNRSGGDGFVDRSKVKILLCDSDSKSSAEVFTLLLRCSYQVISVKSARQVINALNAEGPSIDIILTEIDLPMAKGMKMLKYVIRDKELQRIPVIMMSAQDEVSVVVKCLRLGAADYLVKPLRTNELLNLWTHIWRRRRMLGLAEKQILNFDIDLARSDLSDQNTNSKTLLSDDTDDKILRSTNSELGRSHQEDASAAAAATERQVADSLKFQPNAPSISKNQRGLLASGPKKCKLKIGESSAFFTYCKDNKLKNKFQAPPAQQLRREESPLSTDQQVSTKPCENGDFWPSCSQGDDFHHSPSVPDSQSMETSSTLRSIQHLEQTSLDYKKLSQSQVLEQPRNESQPDVAILPAQINVPFYLPGVINQALIQSSAELYYKNLPDFRNLGNAATMPQYSHLHHFPSTSGMPPFPFYPPNICFPPGHMPSTHPWPSFGSSSSTEVELNKVNRREAALIKFRLKRKERCFEKKIRYVNRKQLAERRPRLRGQFIRKVNGVNVDLNGQPSSMAGEDDDEEMP